MTERQANELLDIVGAAGYLDVPVTYVRRLVLEKRVTYHKVGKYVRFVPPTSTPWLTAGRVGAVRSPGHSQQIPKHSTDYEGVAALYTA
jgi:excisionase family DNA binding protein